MGCVGYPAVGRWRASADFCVSSKQIVANGQNGSYRCDPGRLAILIAGREGRPPNAGLAHCIFECVRADFTCDESLESSATTSRLAALGHGGRARVQRGRGAHRRDSGNGQSGFGCDAGYGSLPPSHCAARRAFEGSEAFAHHQLPLLRQRRSMPMRLHFSGRAAGHCRRSRRFGSADPGRKWAHATTRRQGSKPSASPPDLLIWQHRCPGQPI